MRLALAGGLLSIGLAPSAGAGTSTYSYNGIAFTNFGGTDTCPPECHLSGWFTISTLAAGLNNATITPALFQFTDGFAVLDQSSPYLPFGTTSFQVTTDGTGHITAWNIILEAPTIAEMQTYNGPGTPFDETWEAPLFANFAFVDYASAASGPARWVPEPSALLPLGLGLLVIRVRIRAAKLPQD
jgi:hypothetical protein